MDSDINYIIQQSLNGDKNNQEILLEMLSPLIYKNIYKYWKTNDPIVKDLVQEGYIIILKSLQSFDKNRNVHYLHYVKIKIMYYYKNYYRNTKNQRNNISLKENMGTDKLLEFKKSDSNYNTLERIIAKEEKAELLLNIKKLSDKEQKILYLYYFKEMSMDEISKYLNIKYRTVISAKYNAIKKLRKFMT